MAVSTKRHKEEAARKPVDKKKLVDMLENSSKIGQNLYNGQRAWKTSPGGAKTGLLRICPARQFEHGHHVAVGPNLAPVLPEVREGLYTVRPGTSLTSLPVV